jgi:hypothetical protein
MAVLVASMAVLVVVGIDKRTQACEAADETSDRLLIRRLATSCRT